MCLNPTKCTFGVQAEKFLGFMLTKRGIKANLDKFHIVIAMKSPTNFKEVQQLSGRLTALSRFLSCTDDKTFLFCLSEEKGEI